MENDKPVWSGWETVRLIGRGSFGAVYEIERDVFGEKEKAALKVISIPPNESEIEALRTGEGYDDESLTAEFTDRMNELGREYSLMRKLNGNTNVVNCDDMRCVRQKNGVGWDIFIRMEYLTPLKPTLGNEISSDTVVRLGVDICRALCLCEKNGVLHRDIKPENIFISKLGDYKLGDFGISRTLERTTGATMIGTYTFMAPEVYNHRPYNHQADIYSLGLVLYWMLNERRTPFLPLPPKVAKSSEKELAQNRRFAGEPIPAPKNGSEELKRIVLKACAYDVNERYRSAEEMLAELEALGAPAAVPVTPFVPVAETPEDEGGTLGAWAARAEDENSTVGIWASKSEPQPKAVAALQRLEAGSTPSPLTEDDGYCTQSVQGKNVLRAFELCEFELCEDENEPLWGNANYKCADVKTVTFSDQILYSGGDEWDISANGDGSVMARFFRQDGSLTVAADGKIIAGERLAGMFLSFTELESVNFNSCLDTRNVTNMTGLFAGCKSLQSLDLSSFDTRNVTNMTGLFFKCYSLQSLDLSSFDTRNVTNMRSMFDECHLLRSLDLSSFDTRNVTNMHAMFYNCCLLRSLDLSGLDTRSVTDMQYMFSCCDMLRSVQCTDNGIRALLPEIFGTVDAAEQAPQHSQDSGFQAPQPQYSQDNGFQVPSPQHLRDIDLENPLLAPQYQSYEIRNVVFSDKMASVPADAWDVSAEKDRSVMAWVEDHTLHVEADGKIVAGESLVGMFFSFTELESVNFNSCLDTQNVTDMTGLFAECKSLQSLDLSSFDTRNVTNMLGMFSGCHSLQSLDLSSFNTRNVTDMSDMFAGCKSLQSLDLSSFDTRNVTNMSDMFFGCESLQSLDLSSFDTRNVAYMSWMFFACRSLHSIDLSSFDTRNVENMSHMFDGCKSLQSLDLSSFDTGNVTDMSEMFSECYSLQNLDLSSFDTRNVTNMHGMFFRCCLLRSLDLSGFDTRSVTDTQYMFLGCDMLRSVQCTDNGIRALLPEIFGTVVAEQQAPQHSQDSGFQAPQPQHSQDSGFQAPSPKHLRDIDLDNPLLNWQHQSLEIHNVVFSDKMANVPADAWDVSAEKDRSVMAWVKDHTLHVEADGKIVAGKSLQGLFYKYGLLESVSFNGCLDTGNVTDMHAMFSDCHSLQSLDLSSFDTRNVTCMSWMFFGCFKLKRLDLSSFDTRNVADMSWMFFSCSKLESLDLSSFDTRNVADMSCMFHECKSLQSLDLSSFDTRNVTNMYAMFSGCSKLKSLDISKFRSDSLKFEQEMFHKCRALRNVRVTDKRIRAALPWKAR